MPSWRAWQNQPGKKTWQLNPCPLRPHVEGSGGKVGGTYLRPKDSNAVVGVRDHATQKALEGLTDRQTDRHYAHYNNMASDSFVVHVSSL